MAKSKNQPVELPASFVPFVGQKSPYRVLVQKNGTILLQPKRGNRVPQLATVHAAEARANIDRARLKYAVADRRLTPERAKTYGMSDTRLKVYRTLYGAKQGLLARDLMAKTKLPHGSIQQTLNWLRGHKLVNGEELAAA